MHGSGRKNQLETSQEKSGYWHYCMSCKDITLAERKLQPLPLVSGRQSLSPWNAITGKMSLPGVLANHIAMVLFWMWAEHTGMFNCVLGEQVETETS